VETLSENLKDEINKKEREIFLWRKHRRFLAESW